MVRYAVPTGERHDAGAHQAQANKLFWTMPPHCVDCMAGSALAARRVLASLITFRVFPSWHSRWLVVRCFRRTACESLDDHVSSLGLQYLRDSSRHHNSQPVRLLIRKIVGTQDCSLTRSNCDDKLLSRSGSLLISLVSALDCAYVRIMAQMADRLLGWRFR